MRSSPEHDVVIVGGGPAGASAACRLARNGRPTLLIERSTGPHHTICGEFLSIEAQTYLADLGIDPKALGGAPLRQVRLVHGRQVAEAALPFEGVGLTRRTLDEALLSRAAASGVAVRRGEVAREIAHDDLGLRVHLRGNEAIASPTVFLATGKHDLHRPRRPWKPGEGGLIGFKTYFALSPAQKGELEGAVEIILFDGGYAGLQSVEAGMVNLCLLVRRRLFQRVGQSWDALLSHLCSTSRHLRARLCGAGALLNRPLTISRIPSGFLHQGGATEPQGLFRLGDQMGVIPSFSGDGMSIALHTAQVAAAAYLERGNAASAYHRDVARQLRGQIMLASALDRISQAGLGRRALGEACRLYPGLLTVLAAWTRVPGRALGQAGPAVAVEPTPARDQSYAAREELAAGASPTKLSFNVATMLAGTGAPKR